MIPFIQVMHDAFAIVFESNSDDAHEFIRYIREMNQFDDFLANIKNNYDAYDDETVKQLVAFIKNWRVFNDYIVMNDHDRDHAKKRQKTDDDDHATTKLLPSKTTGDAADAADGDDNPSAALMIEMGIEDPSFSQARPGYVLVPTTSPTSPTSSRPLPIQFISPIFSVPDSQATLSPPLPEEEEEEEEAEADDERATALYPSREHTWALCGLPKDFQEGQKKQW